MKPYSFDEFTKHMEEVGELLREDRVPAEHHFERNVLRTFDYFKPLYADEQECSYKHGRFCVMMHYMSTHIAYFDRGDFAVFGSERVGALLANHLLRAVHHVFTTRDLSEMKTDPSPDEILSLAEQFREANEQPAVET